MKRIREGLARFLKGRYGYDNLSSFVMIITFVILFVNLFFRNVIVSWVVLVLCFITIFRTLSKNYQARYKENQAYMKFAYPIQMRFKRVRTRFASRKQYKYFKCPQCKKTLRIPRGHGTVVVTCPHCGHRFDKKS